MAIDDIKESNNQTELKHLNLVQEYINFLKKYGVIGLAIGVVMGNAVTQLVNSLVTNILTPILSLILDKALNGVDLKSAKYMGINWGMFVDDTLKFVLISLVIFIAVRYLIVYFLTDDEKVKFKI